MSDVSPMPSRVIQVSVLSFFLFSVVDDSILRRMILSSIAFANDVKFGADAAARTREDIQAEVDAIVVLSDDYDIPLSIDICLVLHCGRGQPQYPYYIKETMIKSAVSMKDLRVMRSAGYGYEDQC